MFRLSSLFGFKYYCSLYRNSYSDDYCIFMLYDLVYRSQAVEIEAGKTGYNLSSFVPNGNKMQDACLILEIDSKEVKSGPVSSNVVFENGKPYFITIIWDGNELTWLKQAD